MPNESELPHGSNSNNRRMTLFDMKAKVVRLGDGSQVSGRFGKLATDSLGCLLPNCYESRSAVPTTRTPVHHSHQHVVAMTKSSQTQQT